MKATATPLGCARVTAVVVVLGRGKQLDGREARGTPAGSAGARPSARGVAGPPRWPGRSSARRAGRVLDPGPAHHADLGEGRQQIRDPGARGRPPPVATVVAAATSAPGGRRHVPRGGWWPCRTRPYRHPHGRSAPPGAAVRSWPDDGSAAGGRPGVHGRDRGPGRSSHRRPARCRGRPGGPTSTPTCGPPLDALRRSGAGRRQAAAARPSATGPSWAGAATRRLPGRRRRRRPGAAARRGAHPRRRHRRLRTAPRQPTPCTSASSGGHRRRAWRGDAAASARGPPSWSATWPSSTPTCSSAARRRAAVEVFDELRLEVNIGQYLDLLGAARGRRQPGAGPGASAGTSRPSTPSSGPCTSARPWPTRTAWPSVAGPLQRLRPAAGRGVPAARTTCSASFGDPTVTGKPVGDDLREGKPTLLYALARRSAGGAGGPAARRAVRRRRPDRRRGGHAIQGIFEQTGARAQVEADGRPAGRPGAGRGRRPAGHRRGPPGPGRAGPVRRRPGSLSAVAGGARMPVPGCTGVAWPSAVGDHQRSGRPPQAGRGPAGDPRRRDPRVHRPGRVGHRRPPRLQPGRGRADPGRPPGLRLAPGHHPVGHRPPGLRPQDRDRPAGGASPPCARPAACRATRAGPSRSTTGWRTATPRPSSPTPTACRPRSSAAATPDRKVVAVIGDGSMTGGMAYEGLNNLGHSGSRVVVVLNDNGRSYAPTVSRLSESLTQLRLHPGLKSMRSRVEDILRDLPGVGGLAYTSLQGVYSAIREVIEPPAFFESLGVRYVGPIDGHDIAGMEQALSQAAELRRPDRGPRADPEGPGLRPGRGRRREVPARRPGLRPGGRPARRGRPRATPRPSTRPCSRSARTTRKVVAITAAMPGPTGLLPFQARWPDRFFDVGIAEQHAVTSAAGMAMGGLRPVVAVYSTFFSPGLRPGQPRRRPARPAGRVRPRPGRHHRRRRPQPPRRARHGPVPEDPGHDHLRPVVGPGGAGHAAHRARAGRDRPPSATRRARRRDVAGDQVGSGLSARRVRAGRRRRVHPRRRQDGRGGRGGRRSSSRPTASTPPCGTSGWSGRSTRPWSPTPPATSWSSPSRTASGSAGPGRYMADAIADLQEDRHSPPVLILGTPAAYIPQGKPAEHPGPARPGRPRHRGRHPEGAARRHRPLND